jgi:hypothetical protein
MASIEGKIVDEGADPVRGGRVILYRENHGAGITRITPIDRGVTNDLGMFEFAPLAPGRYFVSVSAKPWYAVHPVIDSVDSTSTTIQTIDRSLDVAYPTTYSGGATEADGAAPIELKGGDHTEVEIRLFPVPSLHLIYRILDDDGQHGFAPPILEKRVFDFSEVVNADEVRGVSKGVYELTGVTAGTYSVRMRDMGSQQVAHTSELDLRTDGQELDTARGEPEGTLKLTVQMPQQEAIPNGMRIMLLDKRGRNRAFQELDAKGEATIEFLPAGKYSIVIYSPGKPYSVLRTSSDAVQTAGHDVSLPPGASLALTAVLAAGAANIEGFVKRGAKAASGIMVVLIPKESSAREELFRRDQSDSDGSFSLRSVIPGDYTLVAIEDAWGFDWSKPGPLARYALHGQPVTIPEECKPPSKFLKQLKSSNDRRWGRYTRMPGRAVGRGTNKAPRWGRNRNRSLHKPKILLCRVHVSGTVVAGELFWQPKRLPRRNKLDGHILNESFQPTAAFFHASLLRGDVADHDESFLLSLGDRVGRVLHGLPFARFTDE